MKKLVLCVVVLSGCQGESSNEQATSITELTTTIQKQQQQITALTDAIEEMKKQQNDAEEMKKQQSDAETPSLATELQSTLQPIQDQIAALTKQVNELPLNPQQKFAKDVDNMPVNIRSFEHVGKFVKIYMKFIRMTNEHFEKNDAAIEELTKKVERLEQ